ncbi:MAG: hypothetical protein R3258_06335 [Acidimicrobiia bacterium]|nr:hypothetical protein [Acidimicrobiia bacterium]
MFNAAWMAQAPGRAPRSNFIFLTGAVLGGTTTGTILGAIAALSPWEAPAGFIPLLVGLLLLALAVARDSESVTIRLPENRRLVRQSVWGEPHDVGALMFGYELGTGFRTYMRATLPYVVAGLAVAFGDFAAGLTAGIGFGLFRGLVTMDRYFASVPTDWDRSLRRLRQDLPGLASALFLLWLIVHAGIRPS